MAKILIVDDEKNLRWSLRIALEERGHEVAEAGSGEECLKLLALYQPVAVDLRFIVATLKINNDLERIGDLAVNIAQRSLILAAQLPVEITFDLSGMAEKARQMLKKSLDALVRMEPGLAREVCAADEEVDDMNHKMHNLVKENIRADYILRTDATHTGAALIFVDADGENMIVVAAGANDLLTPEDVEIARKAIVEADVLLVELEAPMETVERAIHVAHEAGVTVLLNQRRVNRSTPPYSAW